MKSIIFIIALLAIGILAQGQTFIGETTTKHYSTTTAEKIHLSTENDTAYVTYKAPTLFAGIASKYKAEALKDQATINSNIVSIKQSILELENDLAIARKDSITIKEVLNLYP